MVTRGGIGAGLFSIVLNERLEQEIINDPEVREQLTELANIAVEYAQNIAPKDSGNMADTIKFIGFEVVDGQLAAVIEVGDGAEYWVFVEYGTGQAGKGSPQPEPGVPPEYNHGPSQGMRAQPFMRPTMIYMKNRIGD